MRARSPDQCETLLAVLERIASIDATTCRSATKRMSCGSEKLAEKTKTRTSRLEDFAAANNGQSASAVDVIQDDTYCPPNAIMKGGLLLQVRTQVLVMKPQVASVGTSRPHLAS